MLDFTPVRQKKISIVDLTADLTADDLRRLTNGMIDTILDLIKDSTDADVIFEPADPDAYDSAAVTEEELAMPWTLGHVIVHIIASAEESAFLAAELARGVPRRPGRSRYEVPWQTIHTIAQCRDRLEESRRMRLASLEMWPDEPHLDNTYTSSYGGSSTAMEDRPQINAVSQFVFGLMHSDSHLAQIADIVRQARITRLA